jgi:predicted ABC-type ATPase
VLAGHNGSGKSTLWQDRLSGDLQIPLINADRLTESILPARDPLTNRFPEWAQKLRDHDERWHSLSQQGVQAFTSLAVERKIPFAFETVFSHWERRDDGAFRSSKIDLIQRMQRSGYFTVLLFVGLSSVDISIMRVETRKSKGGHDVPLAKLRERFPRTQAAIGAAGSLADMTLMFDNSREEEKAFTLVRAQQKDHVLFDCRDESYQVSTDLRRIADLWLSKVVGSWNDTGSTAASDLRRGRLKK